VTDRPTTRRLIWAVLAGTTAVAVAVSLGGASGLRPGGLNQRYAYAQNALGQVKADKNAISRAGEFGDLTRDPTTAADKVAATA
jgi:hypothetical protein